MPDSYDDVEYDSLGGGGSGGGGGFDYGKLVGAFSNLAGTAGQAYKNFNGAQPPASRANTTARAAMNYTPWLIGGGAVLLVLVFLGLLRK